MSLDEETQRKREEFEAILNKYEHTSNFKDFFNETETFRNNPSLLDDHPKHYLYLYTGDHLVHNCHDFLNAIDYFKKASENLNRNDYRDRQLLSDIYSRIGFAYWDLGNEYKNLAVEAFKENFLLTTYSTFTGYDYMYSYRVINKYFLQDIINNEITVVSPTLFNDPVDSPFLSIIKKDKINSENTPLEIAASHFKMRCFVSNVSVNGLPEIKRNCNIEEQKNYLMWSHYADSHKGICVKYKLLGEFSNGDLVSKVTSHLVDVKYENSFKHKERVKLDLTEALATKSQCWEYENEVRLIHYDPNCNESFKALPLGENGTIEAIYFGLRCPEKDIDTIKAILGDNVAYFQMKEDDEDIFKLVEIPLNDKAKAMLEAASEMVAETVE